MILIFLFSYTYLGSWVAKDLMDYSIDSKPEEEPSAYQIEGSFSFSRNYLIGRKS
ncbi:hypothetical protein JCM9157_3904 [Halalkalibacter akibai JCM 9157]|uniref:Uncharacterized protein n=1 Tax=Halalkalibacter akibai (strain ATCC 43226 / DSM 21942 / CIP 109018 / JCM 9157 / 1139) TaxID=1236973 RepID=W4QYF0_HALA3|nr:hypothetical protein JCM9157_3904 [Halalkalibacter akibai JCM 9157]